MVRQADFFILLAVSISFAVSGFLWFSGQRGRTIYRSLGTLDLMLWDLL